MAATACGGGLSHRSVVETSGSFPLTPAIHRVRVEIENGTLGIDVHAERTVQFAGGVRRAADSAELLQKLEALNPALTAATDPQDPSTLVVRGPKLTDAGIRGVFGYELGLHIPADLELAIAVEDNGHVTVANRVAPLKVTTGRGDLRFEKCSGGVKARTGSGVVIAFGMRGSVDIEAVSGGDMQVFTTEPGELLRLRTGQGTVQCFVPPATGFVCSARTAEGRVSSDFGLPVEKTTGYGAAMTGQVGNGRTKIVLTTGSGYLSLQKHDG